jgi:8-oxo-dGTP diphosphatase
MKAYTVVAAVIVKNNEILCMQRRESKYDYISLKWEFPGGKVEDGENEKEALAREIKEELNLEIEIGKKLITVEHEYPDFSLTMHTFLCTSLTSEITLNDHVAFKWLTKEYLTKLDWAAADLPIVNKLIDQ